MLLRIGDFARLGRVTVKALRHYEEEGLLAPREVDRATGYRYWTMTIHNLDEVLSAVQAAGQKIVRPRTEVRPGVVIGMVEDPDGNWVEFIQAP